MILIETRIVFFPRLSFYANSYSAQDGNYYWMPIIIQNIVLIFSVEMIFLFASSSLLLKATVF